MLISTLNILSAVCAFGAAFFWWRSARIQPPHTFGWGTIAPDDWQTRKAPGVEWAENVARMNKWGAGLSGLSACLLGLTSMVGALQGSGG